MGLVSPGMAGGVWLISSMSRARARATRGVPGLSSSTVIRPRGVGDGPGQAADDGLAGDGAVFVVIAQVGVEVARQPVLGVVREQPQHHLQAAAAGAQQRDLGFGVDDVGGQLGGDRVAGGRGGGQFLVRGGDLLLRGGDQPGVLGGRADGRVSEQAARSRSAAASCLFCLADGGIGLLAGRVVHDLGVGLDAGDVVADLVDAVVLAGVLQEVLLPPPRLQPGQDVRRAGVKIGGQDLQHHLRRARTA